MDPTPTPTYQSPALPLKVSSVYVQSLHGKFTYTVDLLDPIEDPIEQTFGRVLTVHDDRLTLLYGRNGSGKTSLLRLLFHGTSSGLARGHMSAIARTQFHRFEVRLNDGTIISYSRENDIAIGPCTAAVSRPNQDAVVWRMRPNDDGWVSPPEQLNMWEEGPEGELHPRAELLQFLAALGSLGLNPVFLGDARSITSDVIDDDTPDRNPRVSAETRRALDVDEAVERARRYLTQLAFSGTQAGTSRVDSVYLNVAAAISKHAPTEMSPKADLLPELVDRVEKIGKSANTLHAYGLLPEFASQKLAGQLESASDQHVVLLQQVLEPYLEGLEQRIAALEPGLTAVSTFVDALNSFLDGKHVEFQLGPGGILILDDETGSQLAPHELSSGEKQIVLLFSDIVALQRETRLFIIDEPELSLNPEWQRQLMPRLLAVTEQSRMQLVAATHSIEIMAQFRERMRPLETSK